MKARSAGKCFAEISLPAFFPSSPAFFIADTPDSSSARKIHPHRATPSEPQLHPRPARPRSILAAYIAQWAARRRHDNPAPGSAAARRAAPTVPRANYAPTPGPPPPPLPRDRCTSTLRRYFLRAAAALASPRRCVPHAGSKYARPAFRPHSNHGSVPIARPATNPTPRVLPAVVCVPTSIHAAATRPGSSHLAALHPAAALHDAPQPVAGFPVAAPTPDRTPPARTKKIPRRSPSAANDSNISLLASTVSHRRFLASSPQWYHARTLRAAQTPTFVSRVSFASLKSLLSGVRTASARL